MKAFSYIMLTLIACSCDQSGPVQHFVLSSAKEVSKVDDIIFYRNEKFNGTLFELNPITGDTIVSQQIQDGLLNGISKRWYTNNQLMEYREYKFGRKNGKQIAFWENGKKRFEFIAKNDAYEGELKEWTVNGNLFHLAHFVDGQEEGVQKMWYENGKIRANYVVLNGKRYGLLGTKNCKNVSDSIFIVK